MTVQRPVLLDGKYVQPEEIDPAKHRYIGRFRPAINPMANPTMDILCTCGQILRYAGQEVEHYNNGCCDMNQYVTIAGFRIGVSTGGQHD